mmetsp:Transcript_26805/g.65683  ORF Transcript_26805/g.65683 Transcript_26805/m.65683 type:complete len:201 (-) Transcript_26805:2593-3195(-)
MDSSRWCMECWAMYASRRLWCCHTSPTSESACSSPIRIFISVVLPAPFNPTSAAREPCVIFTLAAVRMHLSVPGYLKDTSFMYMITFWRDLTPSSGPGSGKRMGLMCAAASPPAATASMAFMGLATSSSSSSSSSPMLDTVDMPLTDATLAMDGIFFIAPPGTFSLSFSMVACFLMALSGDGSAATISGFSAWKSRKPMG